MSDFHEDLMQFKRDSLKQCDELSLQIEEMLLRCDALIGNDVTVNQDSDEDDCEWQDDDVIDAKRYRFFRDFVLPQEGFKGGASDFDEALDELMSV